MRVRRRVLKGFWLPGFGWGLLKFQALEQCVYMSVKERSLNGVQQGIERFRVEGLRG